MCSHVTPWIHALPTTYCGSSIRKKPRWRSPAYRAAVASTHRQTTAAFNCHGPGSTDQCPGTSDLALADLSRCLLAAEWRFLLIDATNEISLSCWTLIALGNSGHENCRFLMLQKQFLLREALAFQLRLNIRDTSLSHIYLRNFICICVS
jgi:hypothetical protein